MQCFIRDVSQNHDQSSSKAIPSSTAISRTTIINYKIRIRTNMWRTVRSAVLEPSVSEEKGVGIQREHKTIANTINRRKENGKTRSNSTDESVLISKTKIRREFLAAREGSGVHESETPSSRASWVATSGAS